MTWWDRAGGDGRSGYLGKVGKERDQTETCLGPGGSLLQVSKCVGGCAIALCGE